MSIPRLLSQRLLNCSPKPVLYRPSAVLTTGAREIPCEFEVSPHDAFGARPVLGSIGEKPTQLPPVAVSDPDQFQTMRSMPQPQELQEYWMYWPGMTPTMWACELEPAS